MQGGGGAVGDLAVGGRAVGSLGRLLGRGTGHSEAALEKTLTRIVGDIQKVRLTDLCIPYFDSSQSWQLTMLIIIRTERYQKQAKKGLVVCLSHF